jgi:phosphatidylinositol glycan class S
VIVIVVGLPLWWKTTTVYRADLPYERILNVSKLLNPLHLTVDVSVESSSTEIADTLSDALNTKLKGSGRIAIHYRVQRNTGNGVRIIPESSGKLQNVVELSGNVLRVPHESTDVPTAISKIVSVFTSTLVVPKELDQLADSVVGSSDKQTTKEQMRVLKSSPGYHLSLTLLVADPEFCHVQWNIEDSVKSLLNPFLKHLGGSSFANFTIESQVNYYTNLKLPVRRDGERKYVSVTYLPEAISRAEAKLASHISQLPDVNFVIYIPKREEYPLYIKSLDGSYSNSNAFLSPQWGGVVVYNPKEANSTKGESEMVEAMLDMESVMPVFLVQLRALLGIPEWKPTPGVHVPPLPANELHDWQLHRLLRKKVIENLLTASSTLTSLVKLLDKVQNMVISDQIQQLVEMSVSAIYESTELLQEGNLKEAYGESVKSLSRAEAAFFDQSILELLYFPDDQKYGVYVPLFVPLGVPILLSMVKVVKWLKHPRVSETEEE